MNDAPPPPSPGQPASTNAGNAAPARSWRSGRAVAAVSAGAQHAQVAFRPTVQALRTVAAESQRSRLPQMAAALSFRTIFGLLPVVVVALLGLRFFASDAEIERVLNQAVRYAGLDSIDVNQAAVADQPAPGEIPADVPHEGLGAPPEAVPGAASPDHPGAPQVAPSTPRRAHNDSVLAQTIKDLVKRASGMNFGAVSVIGIVTLIYAAISMLVEIERAFNQIYRVPAGKSWIRRVTQYWTLLTLGTLFLFATFYVGERFKVLLINTIHAEGYHVRGSVWMILVAYAITVLISTSLFLLMYLSVPNTRVRLLPALAGAFVAAVLWEAGKWGFTQYLHFSTGYSKLYGSIALIPLFLLWVYVTWIVILAGLHVSYFLQHGRHRTTAEPTPEADPAIVDPTSPLLLMRTIAENFRVGQPCTIEALSKRTHLATPITRQIIERAIDKHLIHRVSGEPGISAAPAYVLARAPSDIAASEILGIGFDLTDLPAGSNASSTDMIRSLRQAQLNAVADKTLADLVDPSSRPLPVPGSVSPAVAGTPPNPRPDGYSNGAGVDTLLSRSDPGREK